LAFYQLYDPRSECALTGLRTLYNLHYECKEEALRCLEAGHVAHVYRLLWRVWSTVDHMCSYLMTMAYMKCAREAQVPIAEMEISCRVPECDAPVYPPLSPEEKEIAESFKEFLSRINEVVNRHVEEALRLFEETSDIHRRCSELEEVSPERASDCWYEYNKHVSRIVNTLIVAKKTVTMARRLLRRAFDERIRSDLAMWLARTGLRMQYLADRGRILREVYDSFVETMRMLCVGEGMVWEEPVCIPRDRGRLEELLGYVSRLCRRGILPEEKCTRLISRIRGELTRVIRGGT
jgi:hypothetical protein